MTCTACSSDNNLGSVVCRTCGRRLQTDAESDRNGNAFESHFNGLAKRVHTARVAQLRIADARPRRTPAPLPSRRVQQPTATIDVDRFRVVFGGPHGSCIEPLPETETPEAKPVRAPAARTLPPSDLRTQARAAVWSALAGGACIVRLVGSEGAGATTLLVRLAAGARENGFTGGAVYAADVMGPPCDIVQRVAALIDPPQRLRYYTAADRMRFTAGRRFLVLLDRADLTAADAAELSRLLPDVRFVIIDAPALTQPDPIVLGALGSDAVVTLLEESYGRRIDDENLRVALDLAATAGSLPGSTRLVGIAARMLGSSFISLSLRYCSGDAVIGELIATLPPPELRILAMLVVARAPLAAHHIAYVVRSGEVRACLDHLAACGLISASGELYEVPRYVEHLVPAPADADAALARIVDVLCDVFDSWQAVPVLDSQLAAAESFLQSAAQRAEWKSVLALGPRAADAFGARGAFGAWGRVLDMVEAAAAQFGDAAALDSARHEHGVRAVVIGDDARAAIYLEYAARGRRDAGDESGAEASNAVLALVDRKAATPIAPPAPPRPAQPQPPPAPPRPAQPQPPPARRRPLWARSLLFLGFGIIAVALIVLSLRYKPSAAPVIREFSASPAAIAGGRASQLCVDAIGAAVVEVFPDAVRLSTGKHCLTVQPAATTTYVAVGTAADGRQVRSAVTVAVSEAATAAPPRIANFGVYPARIRPGGSARVCYAVANAHELHIVPRVGKLTQLRACKIVTLREPHRYRYTLSATGENGQTAVSQTHVDVIAAAPPRPRHAANGRNHSDGLIRRAIYQFDATPNVVERGQATSLCVGVDRPARGFVTHVGSLASGITRCYRVAPRSTTVYRLYVALQDETAVQSVTVAVRPSSRRSEPTRGERR
jgi:hypothetical protein